MSWPSPIASVRSSFSRSARATTRAIAGRLEGVRDSRPVVVAGRVDEDLRLALQASERLRVHDPVPVALERRPDPALLFLAQPPRASRRNGPPAATAAPPRPREREPRRRRRLVRRGLARSKRSRRSGLRRRRQQLRLVLAEELVHVLPVAVVQPGDQLLDPRRHHEQVARWCRRGVSVCVRRPLLDEDRRPGRCVDRFRPDSEAEAALQHVPGFVVRVMDVERRDPLGAARIVPFDDDEVTLPRSAG